MKAKLEPRLGAGRLATCKWGLAAILLVGPTASGAATLMVDSDRDRVSTDGACALREAVNNANAVDGADTTGGDCVAGAGGARDTILFDPSLAGATLTLEAGALEITEPLTLAGPLSGRPGALILDAAGRSRLLHLRGREAGTVTVRHMTLTGGRTEADYKAGAGGAILVDNADLVLEGVRVTGNVTTGQVARGGGVAAYGGSVVANRSEISDNRTLGPDASGGGLRVGGDLTLNRSTVAFNETVGVDGGGGGLTVSGFGHLTLNNVTVSNNRAAGTGAPGGGILLFSGSSADISDTSLVFNRAEDGGGGIHRYASVDLSLVNTVIAQEAGAGPACERRVSTLTAVAATDASCFASTSRVMSLADMALGPLTYHGGLTRTHGLGSGSTLLDDNTACADGDQRGVTRPVGGACDLGAHEAGVALDLGDAPEPLPVRLADNGAAHAHRPSAPSGPLLGERLDFDEDGQPDSQARGDDRNGLPDEDGVFLPDRVTAGNTVTVDVSVAAGPGALNAWVDFNGDGDWQDPGEQVFVDRALADGSNPGLRFEVPAGAEPGERGARFRLDTAGGLAPVGLVPGGEVEDYSLRIVPPPAASAGGGSGGGGAVWGLLALLLSAGWWRGRGTGTEVSQ